MNYPKYKKSVVWLRRDIRLKDNTALTQASKSSEKIFIVFCFDSNILKKLNPDDKRLTFIIESLNQLNNEITERGGELLILHGDPTASISELIKKEEIDALFFNEDYEPYALKRDEKIRRLIKPTHSFRDQLIFHPTEVLKKDGTPYKVFTPFKNAWLDKLRNEQSRITPKKLPNTKLMGKGHLNGFKQKDWYKFLGFNRQSLVITPGSEGLKKKISVLKKILPNYANTRDFLEESSTSGLSPYLRHGIIGIRDLMSICTKENSPVYISELIWREFYQMILFHFPHVEKSSFKPQYDKIIWKGGTKELKAWKEGKTGFPIIDAAMRCLNSTGLMPNRLRMVTASFLCKTLLVNWQEGEKYFAEKLLDFDLSANSGGWQWSSSSGCDSQPYFRIFNPVAQSKKFDPDGTFIKRWCPELIVLSSKEVHEPQSIGPLLLSTKNIDYPSPVVDYSIKRKEALEMYKKALA